MSPQNTNAYTVAALGLSASELRFIKIMLGLTAHKAVSRDHGRFLWVEDAAIAQIVIVNSDDEAAMDRWQQISIMHPAANLLLITATNQVPYTRYYCSRPVVPTKVLAILDQMIVDMQHARLEPAALAWDTIETRADTTLQFPEMAMIRQRALVIDDSPTVRKKLVLELSAFNIKTDTAESGELGIEMLRENKYDIVFLDVVLPGMDGYQVCRTIRRDMQLKQLPVIMLSAKSSSFDKVRGSLSGCSSYLTKPVEYDDFCRVLEEYLVSSDAANNRQMA